jgi:hypothetical protein
VLPAPVLTQSGPPSILPPIEQALKGHFINDIEGRLNRTNSFEEIEQASSAKNEGVKD